MSSLSVMVVFALVSAVSAAGVDEPAVGYTREELQPLTKFRQQHRRTIDGRLCAAAFVQNRKAYTDCTDAPNPAGESGRPWCYVESQLLGADAAWNYCAAVVNYDGARSRAKASFATQIEEARGYVSRLQKAQRAGEQALDMFQKHCATKN